MDAFEYAGNYSFIYFEHCEPEVSTSWLFLIVDLCKNVVLIEIRCPRHQASCHLCRCLSYINIVMVNCCDVSCAVLLLVLAQINCHHLNSEWKPFVYTSVCYNSEHFYSIF